MALSIPHYALGADEHSPVGVGYFEVDEGGMKRWSVTSNISLNESVRSFLGLPLPMHLQTDEFLERMTLSQFKEILDAYPPEGEEITKRGMKKGAHRDVWLSPFSMRGPASSTSSSSTLSSSSSSLSSLSSLSGSSVGQIGSTSSLLSLSATEDIENWDEFLNFPDDVESEPVTVGGGPFDDISNARDDDAHKKESSAECQVREATDLVEVEFGNPEKVYDESACHLDPPNESSSYEDSATDASTYSSVFKPGSQSPADSEYDIDEDEDEDYTSPPAGPYSTRSGSSQSFISSGSSSSSLAAEDIIFSKEETESANLELTHAGTSQSHSSPSPVSESSEPFSIPSTFSKDGHVVSSLEWAPLEEYLQGRTKTIRCPLYRSSRKGGLIRANDDPKHSSEICGEEMRNPLEFKLHMNGFHKISLSKSKYGKKSKCAVPQCGEGIMSEENYLRHVAGLGHCGIRWACPYGCSRRDRQRKMVKSEFPRYDQFRRHVNKEHSSRDLDQWTLHYKNAGGLEYTYAFFS